MIVTRQPVLRRFWYAVMPAASLDDGEPHAFTLLGEKIVLWRTSGGGVVCLKDRCCHRTAQLSLGYLENDRIVCGYHGWTFDARGACVRIPQHTASDTSIPVDYRVPAYRAEERYGAIWVALDDPLTDIPEIPEASLPGYRRVQQFFEPWKIGALRLMENSFDSAHVSFVHRGTFGNVARPEITRRDIEQGAFGFETHDVQPVLVRGDQAQRTVGTSSTSTERHMHANWFMPFSRRLSIRYPHGLHHTIVTCATPMNDEETMVLQWAYRNDTEEDVSTADVIAFDRAVTLEDKRILVSCDPDVPLAVIDGEEKHMASDRPGLLMRRMIASLLAEHGESEQRAAAQAPV